MTLIIQSCQQRSSSAVVSTAGHGEGAGSLRRPHAGPRPLGARYHYCLVLPHSILSILLLLTNLIAIVTNIATVCVATTTTTTTVDSYDCDNDFAKNSPATTANTTTTTIA